ncbi:unnamed protein product [Amoebophrya sp. A120]|nr:unnamed protein product [Amoebophrya sp. A120]|eukprot:GSA120T00026289001.1
MQQTTTYSTNYNVGAAPVVGYTPAGHLVPTLHQPFLVRPPAGAQPATTVSDADYLQALYRNLELQTPQVPQLQLLLGDVEQKQDYANDLNVQTTNYNSRSPGTTTSAVLGYLNKGEGLQESNLERKPAGVVLPNATTTKTNYDYEVVNQNPYVMNTTQTALQPVRGPQSYLQQTPGGADDTGGCGVQ